MRILIDICHPAHFHFFRYPVEILRARGHEIVITSRDKDVALNLLDRIGWEHEPLSTAAQGPFGLAGELIQRNIALLRVARRFRPDCMAAIGGIFIAHIGALARVPSVVFYDTENARLQNRLTYPLATLVAVPRCYEGWLPKRSLRYAGYHELSYLDPRRFTPSREIALANGLDANRDTFLVRVVAWEANHDMGQSGWTASLLESVVDRLSCEGKVIVSSEGHLPESIQSLRYEGDPLEIHHLMAFCRLHIGESATMASESAILGIPAIYAAHTGRGYTNDQESRYQLVKNVSNLDASKLIEAIDNMLAVPVSSWNERRTRLLNDSLDVATHAADLIESKGVVRPAA